MEKFIVVEPEPAREGHVRMYRIEAKNWAEAQVELEPDSMGLIFLEQDFHQAYEEMKSTKPKLAGERPHRRMRP